MTEQQVETSLVQDLERLFGEPEAASAAADQTNDLSNQAGEGDALETPAQTDSETEAEAPSADAEMGDAETDGEEEAPKTVPYRRLAKEIAKRKALEERLEALEAKAETKAEAAEPAAPVGPTDDPEVKPHRERETKLTAELTAVRDLKALLKTKPDLVAEQIRKVDPQVDSDEQSLRDWLDNYADQQRDRLAETKAQRVAAEQAATMRRQQQEAAARTEAKQQVDAVAPWVKASANVVNQLREAEAEGDTAAVAELKRKVDPRWATFARYMAHPDIQRHPLGLKVAAGLAELDHRLALAQAKPAAPAGKPTVRPATQAPHAAPRKTGQPADRRQAALKQFEQAPTEEALLAALDY
jgi:hypothetical protein